MTTDVASTDVEGDGEVLTPDALDFAAALHRELDARRTELLNARASRAQAIAKSGTLDFLAQVEVRSAPSILMCRSDRCQPRGRKTMVGRVPTRSIS
ncbi:MAG: hypothetical protein ACRDRN_20880 [Sciscionella sp.]